MIAVAEALADYSTTDIAETMGVSRRTVQRWLHNGVDAVLADEIAVKVIGDHPSYVWGADWTNAE